MKRIVKSRLRKFNHTRALTSLTVFSLALVGFSAIAYSATIPSIFSGSLENASLFGPVASAQPEKTESVSTSPSPDAGLDGSSNEASTTKLGSSLGSLLGPSVSFSRAVEGEKPAEAPGVQNEDASNPPVSDPDTDSSQSGNDSTVTNPNSLPEEVEEDIHNYLLACYADLQPYYNEVCTGFERLYSTMYSKDPSIIYAQCAPTDAFALLHKCDQARIRVESYSYNGQAVLGRSKWRDEAHKLALCFNDLTNSCSAMRTVSGFTKAHAPDILAPHLNSDGEVKYLRECSDRAATIRL